MRRGFTLSETLLTLAVAGLLFGFALPRAAGLLDAVTAEAAAQELAAAHRRARMAAVTGGRPVVLSIASDTLVIRARGAAADLWLGPGPAARGVDLAGSPRSLVFSPAGLSMGLSNATFALFRGGAVRTVVISRLGRVRVLR